MRLRYGWRRVCPAFGQPHRADHPLPAATHNRCDPAPRRCFGAHFRRSLLSPRARVSAQRPKSRMCGACRRVASATRVWQSAVSQPCPPRVVCGDRSSADAGAAGFWRAVLMQVQRRVSQMSAPADAEIMLTCSYAHAPNPGGAHEAKCKSIPADVCQAPAGCHIRWLTSGTVFHNDTSERSRTQPELCEEVRPRVATASRRCWPGSQRCRKLCKSGRVV